MIRIDQTVGRKTKHKMLWAEDVANLMMGWGLPNEVAWMVAMDGARDAADARNRIRLYSCIGKRWQRKLVRMSVPAWTLFTNG